MNQVVGLAWLLRRIPQQARLTPGAHAPRARSNLTAVRWHLRISSAPPIFRALSAQMG
jgi:hypothetical protein